MKARLFDVIAAWLVGAYMGVALAQNPHDAFLWIVAGAFTLLLLVLWVRDWRNGE